MGAGGGASGFGDFLAGGFRNDVFGTTAQGNAAQNAALEQQSAAKGQQSQALDLAKATPQELQAYDKSLQGASTQLDQQQKIIDSIDPAIMSASKQVLSVLQGGQTGIGNAMGAQRNSQRADLVNSLRSQYGPGAESSSIGQRQLQAFDRDTASLGAQAQGSTLQNLMGVIQSRPNVNGALGALNAAGQNYGGIQNRQLGALMGTGAPIINSAGADQTSQLIQSGAQRQFFDNWSNSSMKFGQQMGGAGMSQGMSGGGGGGGSGGGGSSMGSFGNYDSNMAGGAGDNSGALGNAYGGGSGGMDWNYGSRLNA